jgi:hypothetical protein
MGYSEHLPLEYSSLGVALELITLATPLAVDVGDSFVRYTQFQNLINAAIESSHLGLSFAILRTLST